MLLLKRKRTVECLFCKRVRSGLCGPVADRTAATLPGRVVVSVATVDVLRGAAGVESDVAYGSRTVAEVKDLEPTPPRIFLRDFPLLFVVVTDGGTHHSHGLRTTDYVVPGDPVLHPPHPTVGKTPL